MHFWMSATHTALQKSLQYTLMVAYPYTLAELLLREFRMQHSIRHHSNFRLLSGYLGSFEQNH